MVHQYKLNGFNIVLDTCSGGVHVVDEVAYDMIALFKEKSKEEIVKEMLEKYGDREDVTEEELYLCYGDIETLVESKQLYTEDTFESMGYEFKGKDLNITIKGLFQ